MAFGTGWIDQRELFQATKTQRFALQHNAGEVRSSDLGSRERVASFKVFGTVESHADAGADPSATARTLVGTGAADRFDR